MSESIDYKYLETNLSAVRERIRLSAEKCGRCEKDILLLVATKYASCEEINRLIELGVTDVGENRVNTLLEHYEGTNREKIAYHFIGTLQKNKVKYLVGKIKMLHSLDSKELALEIEKRYGMAGEKLDCLVEINIAEEESKGGIFPLDLSEFLEFTKTLEHVNIKGFMTMAPATCTEDEFEKYFTDAYTLSQTLWKDSLGKEDAPFLSVGMSRSLEAAVKCGSTCVRIGSDIFGHK